MQDMVCWGHSLGDLRNSQPGNPGHVLQCHNAHAGCKETDKQRAGSHPLCDASRVSSPNQPPLHKKCCCSHGAAAAPRASLLLQAAGCCLVAVCRSDGHPHIRVQLVQLFAQDLNSLPQNLFHLVAGSKTNTHGTHGHNSRPRWSDVGVQPACRGEPLPLPVSPPALPHCCRRRDQQQPLEQRECRTQQQPPGRLAAALMTRCKHQPPLVSAPYPHLQVLLARSVSGCLSSPMRMS